MLVTVIETSAYLSKSERIMPEEEMSRVVEMIAAHAGKGDVIKGGGGLRKMRIGLEG